MAGLLEDFGSFIKTPEGQGLLSAAFGGLAGAQRGAPLNSIGRAGMAGVMGYGNAIDRQTQQAEAAQMQAYRKAQMDNYQAQADERKANLEAAKNRQSVLGKLYDPGTQGAAPLNFDSMLPPELRTGIAPVAGFAPRPAGINKSMIPQALQVGITAKDMGEVSSLANLGMPEIDQWKEIEGPNGAKILQGYDKRGNPVGTGVSGYVAPVSVNQGDRQTFVKPSAGLSLPMNMSFADKNAASRLTWEKTKAEVDQDAVIDPLAVRMVAQQYLAGDSGALQNYGRGTQGAKNLNLIRSEIAKQANVAGMSGADIAAKMAEFGGIKAGQRTAGTRSANIEMAATEAASLAPLAIEASSKVTRNGFLPFGKVGNIFDSNTNDPSLRQFAMANNALVNVYGQVMSRGGVATVSDKEHAKELLSTAFDHKSYVAAVDQLNKEIAAARTAPKAVREEISSDVNGRHTEATPSDSKSPTVSDW
jgi:hypothetical protein